MTTITLIPAYGRDYKSAKKAVADYAADKDFILHTFGHPTTPINRSQILEAFLGAEVKIRYNKLRFVVTIK